MPIGAFRLNTIGKQVPLAGGWNLTGASYDNKFISVLSQEGNGRGIYIGDNGTKMFLVGSANDRIYQYSLSTPWDVSSASYSGISYSILALDGTSSGLFFNDTGTKAFLIGSANDRIYQINLSTAWDVSSVTSNSNSSISGQEVASTGMTFKADGTKCYVIGTNNTVFQYSCSSAWTLPLTYDNVSFSYSSNKTDARGIAFNDTGTIMYLAGGINSDTVVQYNLSTAWILSTASYVTSFDYSSQESGVVDDIFVNPNSGKFYLLGSTVDRILQYSFGS